MSEQVIFNFATIGQVYEDGVSLIFDGQDEPSQKHYKVNTAIMFSPGDRVKILSDCGTYVVEYVVGNPQKQSELAIPPGGKAGQLLMKNSDTDFDVSWSPFDLSGGSYGYALVKGSAADYDFMWSSKAVALRDINSSSGYIQLRYVSGLGFQIRSANTSWITITTK